MNDARLSEGHSAQETYDTACARGQPSDLRRAPQIKSDYHAHKSETHLFLGWCASKPARVDCGRLGDVEHGLANAEELVCDPAYRRVWDSFCRWPVMFAQYRQLYLGYASGRRRTRSRWTSGCPPALSIQGQRQRYSERDGQSLYARMICG